MRHIESAHESALRNCLLAAALITIATGVLTPAQVSAQPSILPSDLLLERACGIAIAPVYYGEVFTNASGGLSTNEATQYHALFDLAFELDFDERGSALPGKLFLVAQNTHGRGITEVEKGQASYKRVL